jgi:hypothetical protein
VAMRWSRSCAITQSNTMHQLAELAAKEAHRVRVQTEVRFQRRGPTSPIDFGPESPSPRASPIGRGPQSPSPIGRGPGGLSPRASPIGWLWTREPESKGESD